MTDRVNVGFMLLAAAYDIGSAFAPYAMLLRQYEAGISEGLVLSITASEIRGSIVHRIHFMKARVDGLTGPIEEEYGRVGKTAEKGACNGNLVWTSCVYISGF
jgi:hypothetical protein